MLSELEILNFFRKNLKEILKFSQEDILEKIKLKIISLPILERNGFKKELFLVLKDGVKKEKIEPKEVIFLVNYLKISSEEEPEEEILIKDEKISNGVDPIRKSENLSFPSQEIGLSNGVNKRQEEMWEMIKTKRQKNQLKAEQPLADTTTQLQATSYKLQANLRRPIFKSLKPKTESIKFTSKLMGPIEELKNFSLNEFRKLGNTAQESIQGIEEKINILEKDSLFKKAEGIKAWQNSEINKLYLEIGRASLEKNIPISKVIDERINNNLLTLTIDEFEAITDLNRRLRF
ncbi:hypothetical protein HY750_00005 [Candidatus Kuenenbacteria bacterium]|nr:hypothetical protein [Candidatus Kuenenbacteria bacterium]